MKLFRHLQKKIDKSLFFSCILACIVFCMPINSAQSSSISESSLMRQMQQRRVTINFDNAPIITIINAIQEQTGIIIGFHNTVDSDRMGRFTIHAKDETVAKAVNTLLGTSPYTYKEIDGSLMIVNRDPIDIKGKVVDSDGKPIIGATLISTSGVGTITDDKGLFALTLKQPETVEISCVGYTTITQMITESNANLKITMQEDEMAVEDVVVIGYGTKRKKDLTGAVAVFDTKTIEESGASSLAQMLQGQVSGLSVLTGTGAPGSQARMEVRGVTSLTGSTSPLIVLDNMPMQPDFNINDINPHDVESLTVLKGASSSAIYGSRGASGVIIITTKSGKKNQKPTINYSFTYGIETLKESVNTLTTSEYKMLLLEGIANTAVSNGEKDISQNSTLKQVLAEGYFGEESTPWMELLMQNGIKQQHDISIRGGGVGSNYNASFSYVDEAGQLQSTGADRFTYNIGFNTDINEFIKASVRVNGTISNSESGGLYMDGAMSARPDLKAFNDDGTYYLHSYESWGTTYYTNNPLIELNENRTDTKNNSLMLAGNIDIQLHKNLLFTTQLSSSTRQYDSYNFAGSRTSSGRGWGSNPTTGKGRSSESESKNIEYEARLNYNKIFEDKHRLTVMTAGTYSGDEYESMTLTGVNFADDYIQTALWQAAMFDDYYYGDSYRSKMLSVVARADYSYDGKYMFTATYRADGSSRFAAGNRWGSFPSFAAAWAITEEDFLKDVKWLPELKLRVEWGKTGNGYVDEFAWRTLFSSDSYRGKPSIVPAQIGNEELKWESTTQFDIGIDFTLLESRRIRGSVGYYNKKTDGIIYPLTLPTSTGLDKTNVNFANIDNHGIEIDLNFDIIRKKDFNWSANFNIGRNINKVSGLETEYVSSLGASWLSSTVIKEGESLGLIYGFKTDGIFQTWEEVNYYESLNPLPYQEQYSYRKTSPGDIKYVDLTGDGRVNTAWNQHEDKAVLGCSRPDFEGGFGTRLSYKGFTFALSGTYSFGAQKIWNGEAKQFVMTTSSNNLDVALKRWTPQNMQNDYPSVKYSFYSNDFTDFYVYDVSYVKIQNVSLEYNIPQHLLDKVKVLGRASAFFSMTDPITFTNYPGPNPESWSSNVISGASQDYSAYPSTRTFNFGLRLTLR